MSYCIQYECPSPKQPPNWTPLLFCVTAVLLFTAVCVHPSGREVVYDFLFPGGGKAAGQALETMAEELKQGSPIGEAVESFCREIMAIENESQD